MGQHADGKDDLLEDVREAEHGAGSLLREQYISLTRLVPVLYTVVIIATVAISIAFTGTGPAWLVNWIPAAMLVVVVLRLRYWLKARAKATTQDVAIMKRDIRGTTILGPALTLGFTLIGIGLMPYADTYQQSLAVVAIWITAVASAFCLAALPNASLMIVVSAGVPLSISFLWSGNDLMMMLAGVFAVVTGLVVYMLRENYAAFREIVMSRFEIDEKHRSAEEARKAATVMAYTDFLTNLSNRRHFEVLLNDRVSSHSLAEKPFAVGILDLDGFKPINDVHGHGVGDSVLFEVASRLALAMNGRGRAARMGGDEFAVLAEGIASEDEALALAAHIRDALSQPYQIGPGLTAEMTCSMGFALYPSSSINPARLIDHADMALYQCKARQRGSAAVFSAEHEDAAVERAQIEQGLRRAIAEKALTVYFQPIVDLSSGRLTGFEALARWRDPVLGYVSPAVFIPIAERAGLIEALTDDLLYKAARAAASWPDNLVLSFNLSADQLVKESAGLRIVKILADAGLPPHRFEAEVTETAIMRDIAAARRTLESLKSAGARVALDDFGTGYSSLSQIKDLPLDKVKIDKSFVDQIVNDPKMRNLVRAIISMCDNLELRCVAEGIEQEDQLTALQSGGCASGQGYLFSRPIPIDEVRALIETKRRAA
ncbi:MAG TPA: EAL domain-containing protein [Beijerinckiaceae bacterium]|nr:EAL domain-containing protein [Beijerinckiaceae bacterium]